jgi:hypothetical protein
VIGGVTRDHRWMFEFVRSFSAADWLNQAEGISQAEKLEILNRHST